MFRELLSLFHQLRILCDSFCHLVEQVFIDQAREASAVLARRAEMFRGTTPTLRRGVVLDVSVALGGIEAEGKRRSLRARV